MTRTGDGLLLMLMLLLMLILILIFIPEGYLFCISKGSLAFPIPMGSSSISLPARGCTQGKVCQKKRPLGWMTWTPLWNINRVDIFVIFNRFHFPTLVYLFSLTFPFHRPLGGSSLITSCSVWLPRSTLPTIRLRCYWNEKSECSIFYFFFQKKPSQVKYHLQDKPKWFSRGQSCFFPLILEYDSNVIFE